MNSKAWYLSKTLWANVIMLILATLDNAYFGGLVPSETKVLIVTALNFLLRFLATQPIAVSAGKG
jgi:hypothetical protein